MASDCTSYARSSNLEKKKYMDHFGGLASPITPFRTQKTHSDRFIPCRKLSFQRYKAYQKNDESSAIVKSRKKPRNIHCFSHNSSASGGDVYDPFIVPSTPRSLMRDSTTSDLLGSPWLGMNTPTRSSESKKFSESRGPAIINYKKSDHKEIIAKALGIHQTGNKNLLSFNPSSKSIFNSTYDLGHNTPYVIDPQTPVNDFNSNIEKKSKSQKNVKPIVLKPFKILGAPYLRDDFYSNLVSWSRKTNEILVGLANNALIWSETSLRSTFMDRDMSDSEVSCVSFSNDYVLIVATKGGVLSVYSAINYHLLANYCHSSGICCILWLSGSRNRFFMGDETGNVVLMELYNQSKNEKIGFDEESNDNIAGSLDIRSITTIKEHTQQICGLSLSSDHKQIAIGGNDDCCSVWNIENMNYPKLLHKLNHNAAVKAMAFCPWSRNLLVTGGGTKDRTIRFWHSISGTLLRSFDVTGQITSLTWSKTNREFAVTYGFGGPGRENRILLAVYTYPKLELLSQVPAEMNHRILSAVSSPDDSSLCVAVSDSTLRFYKLWNSDMPNIVDTKSLSMFGSDLIDLSEGNDCRIELIR